MMTRSRGALALLLLLAPPLLPSSPLALSEGVAAAAEAEATAQVVEQEETKTAECSASSPEECEGAEEGTKDRAEDSGEEGEEEGGEDEEDEPNEGGGDDEEEEEDSEEDEEDFEDWSEEDDEDWSEDEYEEVPPAKINFGVEQWPFHPDHRLGGGAFFRRVDETERYMWETLGIEDVPPPGLATAVTRCRNRKELCEQWAMYGECEKDPIFMGRMCAPSCRMCE